ncbi:SCP protein [Geosmithia morbida]|uniref:SCP protein n=1 Tax=Geosmithia morbida TaxID=1094350 RepID=A0A9P4YWK2_9HYPO|nr:SCP protein [Geosmithia morbida]KAF4124416.1 SCP protein [Geosmithia morbida]
MKTSAFLAAAGAIAAMAGPIDKRALETEWVWETVTVTVTEGQVVAAASATVNVAEKPTTTSTVIAASSTTSTEKEETTAAPVPAVPAPSAITIVTTWSSAWSSTWSSEIEPTVVTTSISPETTSASTSTSAEAVLNPIVAPSSTTSSAAAPSNTLSSYAGTMVKQHNYHRANHSSPDLTWDSDLASWAQNTAETCVFAHDMSQGDGNYGQNLATYGSTGDIDSAMVNSARSAVTDQWYNGEVNSWSFYGLADPPSGANLEDWGHFTQVVWKSSTKVGCYTAKCAAGTVLSYDAWYTVCNYNPPGNYGGEYGKNVLEPLGAATVSV